MRQEMLLKSADGFMFVCLFVCMYFQVASERGVPCSYSIYRKGKVGAGRLVDW